MEGWDGKQLFPLNLLATAFSIYPAVFEITGVNPEPIFLNNGGWGVGDMTCLYWKSDAPVPVVRPLPNGNGKPPKRHLRGIHLDARIAKAVRAFLFL